MNLQQRQDAMRARVKVITPRAVTERFEESGHNAGTAITETRSRSKPESRPVDVESVAPPARLLDLKASGVYLGVSYWTVRDLVAGGVIPCVKIPCRGGRELRRILIDRRDLDAFIDRNKELQ